MDETGKLPEENLSPMERSIAARGYRGKAMNLVDIFATRSHDYQRLHEIVEAGIARPSSTTTTSTTARCGSTVTIMTG